MSYIMFIYKKAIVFIWGGEMKKYTIELNDELSVIYEDIAKMNQKDVEDCLVIILERVIRTMLNRHDEKSEPCP